MACASQWKVLGIDTSREGNFGVSNVEFSEPNNVGYFSCNSTGDVVCDKSGARYYCPPDDVTHCHYDLNQGFESFIRKDVREGRPLDKILTWILLHKSRLVDVKFICRRGMLTNLIVSPYEKRNKWEIGVTLFNGKYYMSQFKDIQDADWESRKQIDYYAFKFEQCLTSYEIGGEPDTEESVNTNKTYYAVVQRDITDHVSDHSILFSGEIDCCDMKDGEIEHMELATSTRSSHPWFKLFRWWAKSYIIGVSRIVCGIKNDIGIVNTLQEYNTEDIPKQNRGRSWKPTCLNFLMKFLDEVKTVVTEDNPKVVYYFTREPGGPVKYMKQEVNDEDRLLPEWYTDKM